MNLDVNQAAELFQSGLAGETEPLRKFGIDLSAAAVEASAYANGIAKAGKPLTEQQKVQARYALLMKTDRQDSGRLQEHVEWSCEPAAHPQGPVQEHCRDRRWLPSCPSLAKLFTIPELIRSGQRSSRSALFIKNNQTTLKVIGGVIATLSCCPRYRCWLGDHMVSGTRRCGC